jgi:hypothetical protein
MTRESQFIQYKHEFKELLAARAMRVQTVPRSDAALALRTFNGLRRFYAAAATRPDAVMAAMPSHLGRFRAPAAHRVGPFA